MKYQLFGRKLQYMGNTIIIKERSVDVKPLRNKLEAIQKIKTPNHNQRYKSFIGMVNFLS